MNQKEFLDKYIGATTIAAVKAMLRKKGRRIRSHNRSLLCHVVRELAKPEEPLLTKLLVSDGTGTIIVWVLGRHESLVGKRLKIGHLSVSYRKDDPGAKRAYSCMVQRWKKVGSGYYEGDYVVDLVEVE